MPRDAGVAAHLHTLAGALLGWALAACLRLFGILSLDFGRAPGGLGLAHDLLEFLIEKLHALGPVDLDVDGGEQQREELGEVALQRLFPRAIVVVLDGGVRGGVSALMPGV